MDKERTRPSWRQRPRLSQTSAANQMPKGFSILHP